ncbi:MAG: hypothetical protein CR997_10905 [Acidobacteria bacterium]|nr:MAG: hypothetical protein CR997_10905 [Acidobacteriota bacterium]
MIQKVFSALLIATFILSNPTALADNLHAQFKGKVEQASPNIADLAEALSPTVVYIERTEESKFRQIPDDPFHQFFRQPDRHIPRVSAGSGVIVSSQGHIITNYHVVEDAESLKVTLNDERVFDAELVGYDEEIDMAVLRIEADGLFYAELGDSSDIRVGEWVIAIGSPLGYRYTVTQGIISALNRGNSVRLNAIENYIQTDAAINFGNSGGPLINMKGEVIGINSAISYGGQNIGFAIPVNLIKASYTQIIDKGSVSRGALGVQINSLSNEAKEFFGVTHGALVAGVTEGSPAEKAGLQPGDLLVKLDNTEIIDSGHLVSLVAMKRPGDAISLQVIHNSAKKTYRVVLGDRADLVPGSGPSRAKELKKPTHEPDIQIESIGLSTQWDESDSAWVITDVQPDTPASAKGIREGWSIIRINQTKLNKDNGLKVFSDLKASKDVILLETENERGTKIFFLKPQSP